MTNTSVAEAKNSKTYYILLNDKDERETPSLVAFDGSRALIGNEVLTSKSKTVLSGMKRMLGRTLKKTELPPGKPFRIETRKGRTLLQVESKPYPVEKIVALLLSKLKRTIEHNGRSFGLVVLPVPSSFDSFQRRALLDAAAIAGISKVHLVEETTAAAIAYSCKQKTSKDHNILIFQLGGGSIDVAIFKVQGCLIKLLASVSSQNIGGEDFDEKLMFCITQKAKKWEIKDKEKLKIEMQLRRACEKVKKDLTLAQSASLRPDYDATISRAYFERVITPFRDAMGWMIDFAMYKANLTSKKIDNYMLIGRCTKMLCIRDILRRKLGQDKIISILHASEAAVFGAAILAEFYSGQSDICLRIDDMVETEKIFADSKVIQQKLEMDCRKKLEVNYLMKLEEITGRHKLHLNITVRRHALEEPQHQLLSEDHVTKLAADLKKHFEPNEVPGTEEMIDGLSQMIEDITYRIEAKLLHSSQKEKNHLNDLQKQCDEENEWICDLDLDKKNFSQGDFEKCQQRLQSLKHRLENKSTKKEFQGNVGGTSFTSRQPACNFNYGNYALRSSELVSSVSSSSADHNRVTLQHQSQNYSALVPRGTAFVSPQTSSAVPAKRNAATGRDFQSDPLNKLRPPTPPSRKKQSCRRQQPDLESQVRDDFPVNRELSSSGEESARIISSSSAHMYRKTFGLGMHEKKFYTKMICLLLTLLLIVYQSTFIVICLL